MKQWKITQSVNLAHNSTGVLAWPHALMVEGDKNAHVWEITIQDGRNVPDLTGASVNVYFNRADNTTVLVKGSVSGNVASVVLDQQCYAIAGPMIGIFRIATAAGTTLTVSIMRFTVGKGPYAQIIDPGEAIPNLDDFLAHLEAMDTITQTALKIQNTNGGPVDLILVQGDPGYTPVRGKDYWTEEDQEAITEEVSNQLSLEIADELAKRGQTQPEFANSIEECIDTTKLYVLPDGCIYAYMRMVGTLHANLVPTAIDSDGTPYNGGLGYKTGWRFGAALSAGVTWESGTGKAEDRPSGLITGLIPYDPTKNKVIRVSGFERAYDNDCYILFFDGNFTAIEQRGRIQYYVESYGQTYTDEPAFDNAVKTFKFDIDTFAAQTPYYGNLIKNNAKYVAFSVAYANPEALTVTFDEEIAFGASYKWANTGHAFVPADYEDRIIGLEEASANHAQRIRMLEMYGADSTSGEDIPAYIKTAADEVIAKVIAQQGNRSFNLVGISDFHYGGMGDNKDNLIRACKAISYIEGRIHVDAVATLGDNIPHGTSTAETLASGNRWFKEINEILKMTEGEGIAMFRTPGNHDRMGGNDTNGNSTEPIPDNSMYSYIGGYNRGCVMGNVPGGWAYRDFPGYNLRVIVLNTSETEGKGRFSTYSGYHMSSTQLKWLVNTLDLSDKSDAAEWQILILSHHRADDWQAAATNAPINNYIFPNILNAYATGGSYTGVSAEDGATITCDFAGKNAAKLIGQIHGHHHAYIYGQLHLGSSNSAQSNVVAISTPTSGFGSGEGQNDDNDGNWYDSVKDTAAETAFCVYSIDLDDHVIHAIHYGAGIDREVAY